MGITIPPLFHFRLIPLSIPFLPKTILVNQMLLKDFQEFNWELEGLFGPEIQCTRSTSGPRGSTRHTVEFQETECCPPGDCPKFHVYPVDIPAMILTGYTAVDVDLGVNILISPIYTVNRPLEDVDLIHYRLRCSSFTVSEISIYCGAY